MHYQLFGAKLDFMLLNMLWTFEHIKRANFQMPTT
jgi:hypothetical protein